LCSDGGDVVGANGLVGSRVAAIGQKFGFDAQILPLRSVGVQGDGRTYAHPVVVAGEADWSRLEEVSTELTNAIQEVNRVVYLLAPAGRPTQQVKAGYLTRDRLDLLRRADDLVMATLERHALMREVTQMPTVLVPLSSDGLQESIVLRPISTDDFMTARFSQLPPAFVEDVVAGLMALEGIEAVFYDITHKPPGTVEWE
jgi:GMP synthase (glutamine-hydrolysing)